MFTLTMLIHDYEPCTVLARPRNRVMFDSLLVGLGCSPLPQQGAGDEDGCRDDGDQGQATAGFPGGAREPCALFVGGEEQALRFLRSHPGAFACVLVAEGEKGDASGLPPDRCFVVRVDDPGALALFMQEACGRIQLWQDRMKSSMLQNGSYQHLIDCSEDILGNFISLTDLSFRLLGWTRGIMPDDEVSRRLVEKGYHDAETIEVFREHRLFDIWERQGGLTVYEESLTAQTESASYIFRMQGTYFVHVIMRFNRRARTAALMDTFDIFIAHLETLVRRDWRERRGGGPVYTRTLAGLLSGKLTESTAIGEELAVAGIRREASFTVLVFSPGDSSGRAAASERHYFMSRLAGEFPDEKIIEYGSTLVLVHQGVPTGDGCRRGTEVPRPGRRGPTCCPGHRCSSTFTAAPAAALTSSIRLSTCASPTSRPASPCRGAPFLRGCLPRARCRSSCRSTHATSTSCCSDGRRIATSTYSVVCAGRWLASPGTTRRRGAATWRLS